MPDSLRARIHASAAEREVKTPPGKRPLSPLKIQTCFSGITTPLPVAHSSSVAEEPDINMSPSLGMLDHSQDVLSMSFDRRVNDALELTT
jgi:hypothetical protein